MARQSSYRSRLKRIRVLLLDVDGVLTDGGFYYGNAGEELKKFHTHDGYGIVKWRRKGLRVGIITGKVSNIVRRRAEELGIEEVHENLDDKLEAYEKIKQAFEVTDAEVAFIGDDEPDLSVLRRVGFSAAPSGALEAVKREVDYVCRRAGGDGAVREVIEMLLQAQSGKERRGRS